MSDMCSIEAHPISGVLPLEPALNAILSTAILLTQKPQKPDNPERITQMERAVTQEDISSMDDDVLVARAQAGDRKAFRVLVERHQQSIAFTVTSMLGRTSEVDDVVQDVFLRCYQTLDKFRGEASFATYIKKMAANKSLDVLRRRKRFLGRFLSRDDETRYLEEPVSETGDPLETDERARMVHAAINKLPPKHRAVIVLRMIEGYSTEETAQMLNLAYGTVLSRLSRAQKKLKDTLTPLITQSN